MKNYKIKNWKSIKRIIQFAIREEIIIKEFKSRKKGSTEKKDGKKKKENNAGVGTALPLVSMHI